MTGHTLALVRDGDVGEMARIHALSFDDAWNGIMLRRILAMPGASGIAAKSDLRWTLSGFALFRIAADECELLTLAVAPEMRGSGIGSLLLEGAMTRAHRSGASSLFLEVAEDNGAARRLYDRRGFRPVGRRTGYYSRPSGSPVDAVTMSVDLDTAEPWEPASAETAAVGRD